MWMLAKRFGLAAVVLLCVVPRAWAQGPPFQTDDPVPVDLHHYEFYTFGAIDGTPAEKDVTGPAIEFNWGAIPRVQLHAILPLGGVDPSNKPADASASIASRMFGLIDSELGAKIAFIKESKFIPQIGSFTMFELPTGSVAKGLGVGKVWYRLPLWAQKNFGPWLIDGGGGETVVPQVGYRNFRYGGFLVKYTFGDRLELGGEAVYHGPEGVATPLTMAATLVDAGAVYHFKHNTNRELMFCYGHSVAGLAETYAYVGIYWTWGKDAKAPGTGFLSPGLSPAASWHGIR